MDAAAIETRSVPAVVVALVALALAAVAPAARADAGIYTIARPQLICPHSTYLFEEDAPTGSLAVTPDGTLAVSGVGVFTLSELGAATCVPRGAFKPVDTDVAGDIQVAPDGALLVANALDSDGDGVFRITGGSAALVAGTGGNAFKRYPNAEKLGGAHTIAIADDGTLLIADLHRARVFRVAGDGTITVAAGNGLPTGQGNDGPAGDAGLVPVALAALPGGGFLVADGASKSIRRVDPDGSIHGVTPSGNPPVDLAVAPDGSIVVADATGVVTRFGPDGSPLGVIAGQSGDTPPLNSAGLFGGDGGAATAIRMVLEAVAVDAAGGVYLYDSNPIDGRIRYVPPSDPGSARRPGVAITGVDDRAGIVSVTYVAGADLSLRLEASPPNGGPARISVDGSGHQGTLAFPRPLKGDYVLSLSGTDAAGHETTDTVPIVAGGVLPIRVARRLAVAIGYEEILENADPDSEPERCVRRSRTVVGCAMVDTYYKYGEGHPHDTCDWTAVFKLRGALIRQTDARCRHGRPIVKPRRGGRVVNDYIFRAP